MFFKQIILHNDYSIFGPITYWNYAIPTQISNKTMSSKTQTNVQPNQNAQRLSLHKMTTQNK
jgi:hypothetical protein